ncbi:hypothetical protein [Streptomyces sp. NPDC013455]
MSAKPGGCRTTNTCKAPGKKAQSFSQTIAKSGLTEGDKVKLNIK